ncbi:hypothetical protein [Microbacterium sp. CIAB417]|uniref:hypothetical protein n=1 Tax=Microbacterium sp. CIAB417 TaxID=2860287 RepID=UPI001FADA560|nr:hypothetical protein [Microbacterium sp. CIAB417]
MAESNRKAMVQMTATNDPRVDPEIESAIDRALDAAQLRAGGTTASVVHPEHGAEVDDASSGDGD